MRNHQSSIGPKVMLQASQCKEMEGEDWPDQDDASPVVMTFKKKIKYSKQQVPRYDSKGRPIVEGGTYGIQFEPFITVCVYDITEEVICIKDTLVQATEGIDQQKINPRLDQKFKNLQNYDEIILKSILKPQQY